jgi:hypothetical protein
LNNPLTSARPIPAPVSFSAFASEKKRGISDVSDASGTHEHDQGLIPHVLIQCCYISICIFVFQEHRP